MTIDGLKRSAVICVVRHGDEHLMLRRDREPNRGLYVPVGGKLEPYESPRDAAIREIREEAGIAVDDVRLIGTLVDTSPTAFNWWSAIYVADLVRAARPEAGDCAEGTLGWFSRVELLALPMPSTDRYIYDYLARGQMFAFSAEYDRDLKLVRLDDELARVRLI
ncbi:MAG: NUDIX hydrolase [Thermoanaerobaculia bacterium]